MLEVILANPNVTKWELIQAATNPYSLFTVDDLPLLFERVLADYSGPMADKWAACINLLIDKIDIDLYSEHIVRIPTIPPSCSD